MNELQTGIRPKRSVALSGVVAGDTALCTVGRTGNDLHYRGYDILDIAERCDFEEIAHLLIHERLPDATELTAYKDKLRRLRGLPPPLRSILELLPSASHPMDVLRTGVSALGASSRNGRITMATTRAISPTGFSLRSHPCCSIGITSQTAAGESKSRRMTTRLGLTHSTSFTAAVRRRKWCERCTPL